MKKHIEIGKTQSLFKELNYLGTIPGESYSLVEKVTG